MSSNLSQKTIENNYFTQYYRSRRSNYQQKDTTAGHKRNKQLDAFRETDVCSPIVTTL